MASSRDYDHVLVEIPRRQRLLRILGAAAACVVALAIIASGLLSEYGWDEGAAMIVFWGAFLLILSAVFLYRSIAETHVTQLTKIGEKAKAAAEAAEQERELAKARQARKKFDLVVGSSCAFAGFGMLLVAACTLAFMCLRWLQRGDWPQWSPIGLGYSPPATWLLGLNKVIAWFYQQQLVGLALFGGVFLICYGLWLTERTPAPAHDPK